MEWVVRINSIIHEINSWLEREKELGSPNPHRIVLATAGKEGIPHSRIVAIREISVAGIVFFTQRGTKKVLEMHENPRASMTLWLPLQQREIIIDGHIVSLTPDENESYWNLLSFDRKIRFSAYASTSGQPIQTTVEIEDRANMLRQQYTADTIPISPYYYGYRLVPEVFYFYTLEDNSFSEVIKYSQIQDEWTQQQLSP
jgi:pyridoxamine 5'-phosphate oxidase